LLLVGPLVPARAGVTLAVEDVLLLDAVVDVPSLAHKGLAAELTHGQKEPVEVISGYAPGISTRNSDESFLRTRAGAAGFQDS
jgi:hypothetical protein